MVAERAADLLPELLVDVADAERLVVDQRAVGLHPRHGVHIVLLGFADERVEHRTGEMPLAGQPFEADDQCVFVGAVQCVARLERDDALETLPGEQGPRLARREHQIAVFLVLRLRQYLDLAADEVRPRVAIGDARAGVILTRGGVNARVVLLLVPRVDVAHLDRADNLPAVVGQLVCAAGLQFLGVLLAHRERERNRPRVLLAAADDDFLLQHLVVFVLRHRPGQWRESAIGDAVEGREIGIGNRDGAGGRGGVQCRDRAGDWFGYTAVWGNQISHRSS